MQKSAGLAGLGVQAFNTLGLERVEAAVGVSMSYSAIIWSELIGVIIFQEIPNAWAVVGSGVVLYSTVHSGFARAVSRKALAPCISPPADTARSPRSDDVEAALLLKP